MESLISNGIALRTLRRTWTSIGGLVERNPRKGGEERWRDPDTNETVTMNSRKKVACRPAVLLVRKRQAALAKHNTQPNGELDMYARSLFGSSPTKGEHHGEGLRRKGRRQVRRKERWQGERQGKRRQPELPKHDRQSLGPRKG